MKGKIQPLSKSLPGRERLVYFGIIIHKPKVRKFLKKLSLPGRIRRGFLQF